MTVLLIVLTALEVLLVVGVLVGYLVAIARSLRKAADALAKVTFGVRAIETQVAPVGPRVLRINEQLEALAAAVPALVEQLDQTRPAEAASGGSTGGGGRG